MDTNNPLQTIAQKDGHGHETTLAYHLRQGAKTLPTLVFLGGYRSDMGGTKAVALDQFCAENNYSLLRFDYAGHGESGGNFKEGTIGTWLGNALHVIDALTTGPLLLIGSSMGGWIGLRVAQLRLERIMGFIGIAAAPDFTDGVWNNEMTPDQQFLCIQQGYITTPDGDIFTHKLFLDGAQHSIFDKPLKLNCPVTLLHGKQDDVVPYAVAQKLAQHMTNPLPPKLILIDDGDHRLARDSDLEILFQEIKNIAPPSSLTDLCG